MVATHTKEEEEEKEQGVRGGLRGVGVGCSCCSSVRCIVGLLSGQQTFTISWNLGTALALRLVAITQTWRAAVSSHEQDGFDDQSSFPL